MSADSSVNVQLRIHRDAILTNLLQLDPLLARLKSEIPGMKKEAIDFSHTFLRPLQRTLRTIIQCTNNLKIWNTKSKLQINDSPTNSNIKFFDQMLEELIENTKDIIKSDFIETTNSAMILAAFIPIFQYYIEEVFCLNTIEKDTFSFSDIYNPFYSVIKALSNHSITSFSYDELVFLLNAFNEKITLYSKISSEPVDIENLSNSIVSFTKSLNSLGKSYSLKTLKEIKKKSVEYTAAFLQSVDQIFDPNIVAQNYENNKENESAQLIMQQFSSPAAFTAQLEIECDKINDFIERLTKVNDIEMKFIAIGNLLEKMSAYVSSSNINLSPHKIYCDKKVETIDEIRYIVETSLKILSTINNNPSISNAYSKSRSKTEFDELKSLLGRIPLNALKTPAGENENEFLAIYGGIPSTQHISMILANKVIKGADIIQVRNNIMSNILITLLPRVMEQYNLIQVHDFAEDSEIIQIMKKLIDYSREIRSYQIFSGSADPFLSIIDDALNISMIAYRNGYLPNIMQILKSDLPSTENIESILNLPKIIELIQDTVKDIVDNPSKVAAASMEVDAAKLTPEAICTAFAKIESTPDSAQYLLIQLEFAESVFNYAKLYSKLTAMIGVNSDKPSEFPQKIVTDFTRLSSSIISLFDTDIVHTQISPEFISVWLETVLSAFKSSEGKPVFKELARAFPFIDFSDALAKSLCNVNQIISIVRNLSNKEPNFDLHLTAESMRTVFVKGIIAGRPDLDAFAINGRSMLHAAAQASPNQFGRIHNLWKSVSAVAALLQTIHSLASRLDQSGKLHLVMFPCVVSNLALAAVKIAEGFADTDIFTSLVAQKSDIPVQFLFPENYNIEPAVSMCISVKPEVKSLYASNLADEAKDFSINLIKIAARQSGSISQRYIEKLSRFNKFIISNQLGLSTLQVDSIYAAHFMIRDLDFNLISPEAIPISEKFDNAISRGIDILTLEFIITIMDAVLPNMGVDVESRAIPEAETTDNTVNKILLNFPARVRAVKELERQASLIQVTPNTYEPLRNLRADIANLSRRALEAAAPVFADPAAIAVTDEENKIQEECRALYERLAVANEAYAAASREYEEAMTSLPAANAEDIVKRDRLLLTENLQRIEIDCAEEDIRRLQTELAKLQRAGRSSESAEYLRLTAYIKEAATQPRRAPVDDSDDLARRFEEVSNENDKLLAELARRQGAGVMSHEDQLDMLLIKSDEMRSLQSSQSVGREELDAIRRQIGEVRRSIASLKKRLANAQARADGDAANPLRSFLKKARELNFNESRPNAAAQRRFIDETMVAAERAIQRRNELQSRRDELLSQLDKK